MASQKVGSVTEQEKKDMLRLYERKLALQELVITLPTQCLDQDSKDELYDRIMIDMGTNKLKFDKWWAEMAQKYGWMALPNGQWNIDFETNEIYLVTP